jgi:hypothetical protein
VAGALPSGDVHDVQAPCDIEGSRPQMIRTSASTAAPAFTAISRAGAPKAWR